MAVEWKGGAQDFGRYEAADPCTAGPDTYPGKGLDNTVQRIALGGLNGAACDLGTSREELILSLDPKSGIGDVTWDRATAAKAIQSGTSRAIDDAVDRGTLPSWAGTRAALRRRAGAHPVAPRQAPDLTPPTRRVAGQRPARGVPHCPHA